MYVNLGGETNLDADGFDDEGKSSTSREDKEEKEDRGSHEYAHEGGEQEEGEEVRGSESKHSGPTSHRGRGAETSSSSSRSLSGTAPQLAAFMRLAGPLMMRELEANAVRAYVFVTYAFYKCYPTFMTFIFFTLY